MKEKGIETGYSLRASMLHPDRNITSRYSLAVVYGILHLTQQTVTSLDGVLRTSGGTRTALGRGLTKLRQAAHSLHNHTSAAFQHQVGKI